MAGSACDQVFGASGLQSWSPAYGKSEEVDLGATVAWMGWAEDECEPVVSGVDESHSTVPRLGVYTMIHRSEEVE